MLRNEHVTSANSGLYTAEFRVLFIFPKEYHIGSTDLYCMTCHVTEVKYVPTGQYVVISHSCGRVRTKTFLGAIAQLHQFVGCSGAALSDSSGAEESEEPCSHAHLVCRLCPFHLLAE